MDLFVFGETEVVERISSFLIGLYLRSKLESLAPDSLGKIRERKRARLLMRLHRYFENANVSPRLVGTRRTIQSRDTQSIHDHVDATILNSCSFTRI